MKAAVIEEYGKPAEVVKVVDRDIPKARDGSVVIKLKYAAVNPVDNLVIQGFLSEIWGKKLPFSPGYDFAGTVHEVGANVSEFKEGEDVWGVNWGREVGAHADADASLTVGSAFAEYIELPANKVSKKPDALPHDQAAAVALVGTTAYQGIQNLLTGKKADGSTKFLVLGGSGAVGQLAIQIAKSLGVWVATTCSPRTREFVDTLGADLVIDYTKEKWDERADLKGLDGIFDTIGEEETWKRATSSGALADSGNYTAIATDNAVGFNPVGHAPRAFAAWFCLKNNVAHQDLLAQMVVDGKLKVKVENEFAFSQEGVLAALAKQTEGKSVGKNVIKF